MIAAGARKLVDYLDPAYGLEYLDRLAALAELDRARGGADKGFAFTVAAAKYVATAMAYDDVPRVADLKIRASRQKRVREEVGAAPDAIVTTTEFFHPRVEEVCGSLPKALGEWIEARPKLVARLRKLVDRGRRIRPNTVTGYLMLAAAAQPRPAPPQKSAPRARERASRSLAENRNRRPGGALRAGRGGPGLQAAGQRLFGHPCARIVEVRPRARSRPEARQTGGWAGVARSPQARGARG